MASQQLYDDAHLRPSFRIKLDGSDMPMEIANDVLEIVVEQSIHMPHACTIRLHDWDFEKRQFQWVDDDRLKEGKSIEVMMGYNDNLATVFEGEITMFEMDAAGHMVPNLVVHCMSKDHRLHRDRVRKTYQEVTDSDIVQQVASACGLQAQADSLSTVRHWVCQNNQTNYEFLKMLAHRNGCRMYADGDTLKFEKFKSPDSEDVEVEYGDSLRSIRPRKTTHGMVDSVSVHAWDMKQKQAILSTKSSSDGVKSAEVGVGTSGGQAASQAFGSATHAIVDVPVSSQAEADSIAQAYIDNRESSFVGGDGLCIGNSGIAAGKTVSVKGVGTRFSGKYAITSATHTFTSAEGYTTQFGSSGKSPNTISDMLGGERENEPIMKDFIAVALVTDNNDPDGMGRIKVQYPWLMDDTSFWARMASPMAGPNRGIYFLPEIGDEVLIAFEHGDIHYPYMIGALWNGQDNPVEPNSTAVSGGKVVHRVTKTRKGHIIMLDDTDSKEQIKYTTQGNHTFCMDDTSGNVQILVKTNGGHSVLLDDTNKKIEVKTSMGHCLTMDDAGNKITLKDYAGTETMTIDGNSMNIEFQCTGQFKVTAIGGISLETPQQIQGTSGSGMSWTSGASYSVAAGASASFMSGGTLSIVGTMVTIN